MSAPQDLLRLAAAVGVLERWTDETGRSHHVTAANLAAVLERLGYPCSTAVQRAASLQQARAERSDAHCPLLTVDFGAAVSVEAPEGVREYAIELEGGEVIGGRLGVDRRERGRRRLQAPRRAGYHRLQIGDSERVLAVAPSRAHPMGEGEFRGWGCAAQIHSLRRPGDGGIGDFAAVAELCHALAERGGGALGLSPSHAPFTADLGKYSPYAPSSRLFLNPLHADLGFLGHGDGAAAPLAPAAADDRALIDWVGDGERKLQVLRHAFEALDAGQQAELGRFREAGGEALQRHACFEALSHHRAIHGGWPGDWRSWSAPLRQPDSAEVAEFARGHAGSIEFHMFAQWAAERSLDRARNAARDARLRIGLVGDLAVGADPGGSETWTWREESLAGLTLGAPPDAFNMRGQGWGLSGFSPIGLRRNGFAAFRDLLGRSMSRFDALRIDHALGFARLWVIPDGAEPADGAYLRMPLHDILRLLRLESVRNGCPLIGEDLGTVPPGLRKRLQASGIYGTDVLAFARDRDGFREPAAWRASAVAMSSTHDLPTVAGWWSGRDLEVRAEIEQAADGADGAAAADLAAQRAQRGKDRQLLWQALRDAGCAKGTAPDDAAQLDALIAAVLAFVGRSACSLVLAPLEDVLALREQPNLPGTVDEYPNWRQRLPVAVGELLHAPEVVARLRTLAASRRRR
ncbi:MAG TPA: 4-alpha-glucanotransferase [Rhodanobacteraceae bacterium]|nr:4-alpha-glucanotransferase [Rhodanobacteraceae bacterium]